MSRLFNRRATSQPAPPGLQPDIQSYLLRLYMESRQALFRILLGETLPAHEPFPVDPDRTADIVRSIEGLISNDRHLEGCRDKISEQFPGELALRFNLADQHDVLFPNDKLRASILNHMSLHRKAVDGQPPDSDDLIQMERLKASSRLQQQLAYLVDYTPNKWLLEQEVPVVLDSRARRLKSAPPAAPASPATPSATAPAPAPTPSASSPSVAAAPTAEKPRDSYAWSRDTGRLSGLCFSGGGIRSATFNLGVLQGLANKDLLRRFDYLSSVSGGGYIHQWLAAWVKRQEEAESKRAKSTGANLGTCPGLDAVCRQLIPQPNRNCAPIPAEPIRWLRRYSNYLTPQTGLFSADTWVTFAIWARNTFLNQIILISALFLVLLVPHLLLVPPPNLRRIVDLTKGAAGYPQSTPVLSSAGLAAVGLTVSVAISFLLMLGGLVLGLRDARRGRTCDSRLNDTTLFSLVIVPLLVISVFVSEFGFYFTPFDLIAGQQAALLCLVTFVGLLLMTSGITWASGAMYKLGEIPDGLSARHVFGFLLAAALASTAGTGAMVLARNTFVTGNPVRFDPQPAVTLAPAQAISAPDPVPAPRATAAAEDRASNPLWHAINGVAALFERSHLRASPGEDDMKWRLVVVFGPLIVTLIPFLAIILQCGLVGYRLDDLALEWLARVRAWVIMYGLAWTLLAAISLFGHQLVNWLASLDWHWVKWTAVGSWLLTTAGGVLAGKSSSSSGEPGAKSESRMKSSLIAAAPPAYILGLLILLSWVAQEAMYVSGMARGAARWEIIAGLCVVIAVPSAIFLLFGWRVDINEFSLHTYYRNRLARCYLGASNPNRQPDPLTGFDNQDVEGLRLNEFQPSHGYTGPLPIFCAALNISVGEDLAYQERKAASFAFGPVLSGYHIPWTANRYSGNLSFNGFVPTARFAYPGGGVHISTATAVSGAAVSPNMGYHTNPAMAFLLTMFNVRLGWWLPNPRRSELAFDPNVANAANPYPHPQFAPAHLVGELLGQIADDRKFVYLTDGGHFDNMGLYELVRRRCYEIVICDAEQDSGPVFEGIGMAIRKCRIDFGAEIELDLNQLAIDATTRASKVHWIQGWIKYPETGDAARGRILYIKSSITGKEAADVCNYRLQHTAFPQDSTADQWFTESQFESYRRLGQQVVDECPFWHDAKSSAESRTILCD
jgi:hypothetical protein